MATTRVQTAAVYQERLGPSLWVIVSAAVLAPMAALVLAPIDTTVALIVGAAVGILAIAVLVWLSPVVRVSDGRVRAGRAWIAAHFLGEPVALTGEDARLARGPGLDATAWHLIRGGIDGVVVVPVVDPDDPARAWVISSRTPDRLAAAIRYARSPH
ncbi:DUF3093 family protein [Microbacterium sp. bgisy207]|uniref:DUF3093 family protein n=1 Tax=Microbacterium sp. bgisy207 TaxID=3413800 RepID=UPI003EC01FB0